MKHTPGPWRITRNPADHPMPAQISGQFHPDTGHRGHVCNVFVHEDNRDSTERANARLIAAAPEMLEALNEALFAMGYAGANANIKHPQRRQWEMARNAIIKALGEHEGMATDHTKATGDES